MEQDTPLLTGAPAARGPGRQIGVGSEVFDQPRLTSDGVGTGWPGGIPRQRPPWFSSDEQYEAFLKTMTHDLGPQCITASSIDVEHLDEQRRNKLLANHALRPTLEFVCTAFAQFDDAALFSRIGTFEKQFVHGLTGDLAAKVGEAVKNGRVLMPPAAATHLILDPTIRVYAGLTA